MTFPKPVIATIYAERCYKHGRFNKVLYGLEGEVTEVGGLSYWPFDDFVEELQRRGREATRQVIYRNFEGSEITTCQSTGCLTTILKTGLNTEELLKLASRVSVDFPKGSSK